MEGLIIGAVVSAAAAIPTAIVGTVQGNRAAATQAAMAERNAKISQQNALYAQQKATFEETQKRMQLNRLRGKQRAAYAAAGVDLSSGTPLDVLADTAIQGELDALAIRNSGQVEAAGYLNDADSARFRAQQARDAGKANATSQWLSAGTTIVSGAMSGYGYGKSGGVGKSAGVNNGPAPVPDSDFPTLRM